MEEVVRPVTEAVRARLPLIYGYRPIPPFALALSDCCAVRHILTRAVAIAERLGVDDSIRVLVLAGSEDVADFWERVLVELLQLTSRGALPYQAAIAEDIAQDLGAVLAYSARRREKLERNWCRHPETRAPFPEYVGGRRNEAMQPWERALTNGVASAYAVQQEISVRAIRSAAGLRAAT
jgi:hypothetical protein